MDNRFTYEAEVNHNEKGGYSIAFPQLPEAFTFGNNMAEAIERAVEVLELIVAEYLDEGRSLPTPVYSTTPDSAFRIAISVVVMPDDIERSKCVTTSEAARMLGVSNGRVTHMLDSGTLQAIPYGKGRLVTLASINARLSSPRQAGRPRKLVAT